MGVQWLGLGHRSRAPAAVAIWSCPSTSSYRSVAQTRKRSAGSARERDQWLRDHGVDLTDSRTVRAVVTASEVAHGLLATDSLSRARRRFTVDDRADSG